MNNKSYWYPSGGVHVKTELLCFHSRIKNDAKWIQTSFINLNLPNKPNRI